MPAQNSPENPVGTTVKTEQLLQLVSPLGAMSTQLQQNEYRLAGKHDQICKATGWILQLVPHWVKREHICREGIQACRKMWPNLPGNWTKFAKKAHQICKKDQWSVQGSGSPFSSERTKLLKKLDQFCKESGLVDQIHRGNWTELKRKLDQINSLANRTEFKRKLDQIISQGN